MIEQQADYQTIAPPARCIRLLFQQVAHDWRKLDRRGLFRLWFPRGQLEPGAIRVNMARFTWSIALDRLNQRQVGAVDVSGPGRQGAIGLDAGEPDIDRAHGVALLELP